MGRVLFGLYPAWGHLAPTIAIAQELQARGHEVAYACHESLAPAIEQAGLRRLEGFNWGGRAAAAQEHARQGGGMLWFLIWIARGRTWTIHLHQLEKGARDFQSIIRAWRPDAIVNDLLFHPGAMAAEAEGVPFATSCPNTVPQWDEEELPPHMAGLPLDAPRDGRWLRAKALSAAGRARMDAIVNRSRRAFGLPEAEHPFMGFSPYLGWAYTTEALEYPYRTLGRQIRFLGPSISAQRGDQDISFPWEWLDGRPLISLSFGSIFTGKQVFYERAAAASRDQPWQIVIKVGPAFEPARAGAIPENVRFVQEQPQLALLERAAAMISHGGVNSCVEALARGLPLLMAPREVDQADFAERVVHAGAGLRLDRQQATATDIRLAIRRVLDETSFRAAARRIADDFARCDGASTGASLVERLMRTGKPVLPPEGEGPTAYAAQFREP